MVIVLFIIFLYLGWVYSSILGILITSGVYIAAYKFQEKNGLADIDDIAVYVSLIISSLVFLSTPIWDSYGYCAHQLSFRETVEVDPLTMISRFGVEYIQDNACTRLGGWEYSGGWSSDSPRAVLMTLSIILNSLILGVVLYGLFDNKSTINRNIARQAKMSPDHPEYYLENVKSIIRVNDSYHRAFYGKRYNFLKKNPHKIDSFVVKKEAYLKYFIPLARHYLDGDPHLISKTTSKEIISYLEWAIKTIPIIYEDTPSKTGEMRIKQLKKYIPDLEKIK